MADQTVTPQQLRFRREKNMIPTGLLMGMVGLVVISLALVTFATVTDRPHVGVPHEAPILAQRPLILDGSKAGDVTVRDATGAVIVDLGPDEAGFVSVIWRGMDRQRMLHKVMGNPPVNLVHYENGRLSIQDPATGWSAEAANFGEMNEGAFLKLLH